MAPQVTKSMQNHTNETKVANRKYPGLEKYWDPKLMQLSKKANTGDMRIITWLSKPLYCGKCIFILFPN
tara:strand:- start:7654 stop:7860 length:207 start_codon:yes stop_codon:yes gene_type:complete